MSTSLATPAQAGSSCRRSWLFSLAGLVVPDQRKQRVQPHEVGAQPEAGNDTAGRPRGDRFEPPLVDVAHVDLHVWEPHRAQTIAERVAGTDESSRVHQQPIDAFVRRAVDAPDRFALDVRIVEFELKIAFARGALQKLDVIRSEKRRA